MFKTMWKMPARLMRDDAILATGSLDAMIEAAAAFGSDEGEGLTVHCVGRDRPIGWAEIQGLRQAATFPDAVEA